MVPCIVLDTETTGFPNNGSGFRGRIVEVGAVVITAAGEVVNPISFLVRQPRTHLESWQARRAMAVHGLEPAQILAEGLEEARAAPRFARWVERVQARHGVSELRAYNQSFDFWFLERDPWRVFERTTLVAGEDIKLTAARAMGTGGPSLKKAVAHCRAQGGTLAWQSRAHRACEDARMAALVAVTLESGQA